MGYTRYWEQTGKELTDDFLNKTREIVANCEQIGISIRGPFGNGEPIIDNTEVSLNGNAEYELDHESFRLESGKADWDFCKTARKPYDYAVREILKVAEEAGIVEGVSSDGDNNEIISDKDYLSAL